MDSAFVEVSKYLSFILRHRPDEIGLTLDRHGWGRVDDLIANTSTYALTPELIQIVVETNDKQRFALSDDGTRIRANQGHSIDVDLNLPTQQPPGMLLHGTAERCWESIRMQGLLKGKRHHVHLTESRAVAKAVGGRYGKPILLNIDTAAMHQQGYQFYKTANNVWLVDRVPASFITLIEW